MIEKKLTKKKLKKLERRNIKKQFKYWAFCVKERDNNRCVICGENKILHAHHILPRENHDLRFDIQNGISLCPRHHKYSFEVSAHKNSFAFVFWLFQNRQDQYNYLFSYTKTKFEETFK